MSETTSAPAAPAAAPASAPDSGPVSPPPSSQPALSVSEAGRLLSQQRRQAAGAEPASPEAATRKPSPQDMVSSQAAQKAADASAQPAAPATPAQPLTALERALGVPGGESPAAPDVGQAIEIEGQRYTTAQLREAVLKSTDYTAKTQELAEQRRQIQAQQEAFATVLPFLQPELQRLAQTVGNTPPMPDPALAQTDPTRYVQERAQYDAAMAEQQRLHNITALQAQAQARAMEQAVQAGNEALAKEFPFWNDPAERTAAQQQIVSWALEKGGFTRDELRGLTDPRHLKTMMKAMAYDKWVQGAKTAAPAQRLAAPVRGAPPPPAPTERIAVSEQAFSEKPNIRNAAALLAARRANGASH